MLFRVAALVLALCIPSVVSAAQLDTPKGDVILHIGGNIALTNATGEADFDLAMLDAMPSHTTTTKTPWYDGVESFSGPVLADLLSAVGAKGTELTVTALNDYSATIPMSDITEGPVILATRLNGETMSVRDKGPLFVIYPFDVNPDLYNEVYFGRSVWQVKSITVK